MKHWFYALNGESKGPVFEDDLVRLFESGEISSATLVWSEGLENWVEASGVDGLVPARLSPPPLPSRRGESPFLSPPSAPSLSSLLGSNKNHISASDSKLQKGIRRREYFIGVIVFTFLLGAGDIVFSEVVQEISLLTGLVYLMVMIALVALRLKNIGVSSLWAVLSLVPIVNLLIAFACACCQPDYVSTQKLDRAGQVIASVFALVLALILLSVIVPLLYPSAA